MYFHKLPSVEGSSLDFHTSPKAWGLQCILTVAEEFPKPKIPKRLIAEYSMYCTVLNSMYSI